MGRLGRFGTGRSSSLDAAAAGRAAARPSTTGGRPRAAPWGRTFRCALAAATGGALDPAPDALLAARPGVSASRAAPPFLVPLVILAVLGDIALRQLGR
jgi:hypothetical protein